jgi:uncharacterized membrane protein
VNLNTVMTKVVALQKRSAGAMTVICLLLFLLNVFMTGFVSEMAPQLLPTFYYGAALFLIGAVANGFLAGKK